MNLFILGPGTIMLLALFTSISIFITSLPLTERHEGFVAPVGICAFAGIMLFVFSFVLPIHSEKIDTKIERTITKNNVILESKELSEMSKKKEFYTNEIELVMNFNSWGGPADDEYSFRVKEENSK